MENIQERKLSLCFILLYLKLSKGKENLFYGLLSILRFAVFLDLSFDKFNFFKIY